MNSTMGGFKGGKEAQAQATQYARKAGRVSAAAIGV
jgi:hypothetical protein